MIVEEEPAAGPGKPQNDKCQRIAFPAHVAEQGHVCAEPVHFRSAAIYSISIVVTTAADIAVILSSIHEQTILAFPFSHHPTKHGSMTTFKRKIFYLSGFDPRGVRFYHWLFSEQVAAAGAGSDMGLKVGAPRRASHAAIWNVQDDDGAFHAEHEFLVWDDLIRRHWVKGPVALIGRTIQAYGHFLRHFDWSLAARVPTGSKIAFFYPGISVLLLPLLLALLLWPVLGTALPAIVALIGACGIALALTVMLIRRIHSLWLLRFVIFNDTLAGNRHDPALLDRLRHFTDRIAASLDEDWDEVLFITHSNGSILSVPIMADLLQHHGGMLPDRFSFVTLGSCIQLIACRKDSDRFAAQLDQLAQGRFRWLDIGSITDGACIPLVDPCLGRPVSRPPGLVQLSPRWFRYCVPEKYEARRRNKYETHFDYLRRLDLPSPLDYVGITCTARPLSQSIAAFEAENV